jgi:hypothetical protein
MIEFLKNISIRRFWWLKLMWNKKLTYLYESGWIRSYQNSKPVDKDGNPLPWLSLPLVDFMDERLTKQMDVFEYGAGNSTLYFAPKVNSTTSVEHNKEWFAIVEKMKPANSELILESVENGNAYPEKAFTTGKKYDIILIDGRRRVECCEPSAKALKPGGVIIYDDSHRDRYDEGMAYLKQQGFKQIDFWGMGPSSIWKKCTTLFYKSDNCLNI